MAHSSLRNHRKLVRLKRYLPETSDPQLIGHLEFLWWSCYDDSTIGQDGKLAGWTFEDIEAAARWDGDDGKLSESLVKSGFIDEVDGTFHIHDYADWAPSYVKRRWKSSTTEDDIGKHKSTKASVSRKRDAYVTERNVTERKETETTIAAGKPPREIYDAYPRKIGRRAAELAASKAVARLSASGRTDSADWLFQRVQAYAKAVHGKDANFIPHMATWMNQERYFDDDKDWESWKTAQSKVDPTKVRQADVSIYEKRVLRGDGRGNLVRSDGTIVTFADGNGSGSGPAPIEPAAVKASEPRIDYGGPAGSDY